MMFGFLFFFFFQAEDGIRDIGVTGVQTCALPISSLQFLEYLHKIQKDTWIRYVLVPGYTDDIEDLKKWAAHISRYSNIKRVDILPFHQMAIYKWEKEKRNYTLKDVLPPTKEEIVLAEELFRSYGLPIFSE